MITLSNKDHWLFERVKLSENDKAIIFNGREVSFGELQRFTEQAAKYFKNIGVKQNDNIAIISENNAEFIITIFALWLIGAYPVPLNIRSTVEELNTFIKISKSKFLINIFGALSEDINLDTEIIIFDSKYKDDQEKKIKSLNFDPTKTALILFTSGSSGTPKCVPISFNNLFSSAKSADEFINHSTNDVWLASLPFYHIGGFSIITRAVLSGCSLIIPKSIKKTNFRKAIKQYSPSLLSFVPVMFNKLLEENLRPWEELKVVFIGGGPVSEKLINNALSENFPIALVYGSTETSSMVTFSSSENLRKNGLSAGIPFSDVVIEISKNEELTLNGNDIGRICIKSKSVASSYFNSAFNEEKEDLNGGKFTSNDLGFFDEKGNLNIIGRRDDIILSGGENISLLEIKKLLVAEFKIDEFELLGVKDKKWDQSYIIVVETTKNAIEKEISKFLQYKLASFKLPQNIYGIEKIPRNEIGKVQKEILKQIINIDFL